MADVITQAPDATVTPQTPIAPKEKAAPVDLGAKPGVTSLKDALQNYRDQHAGKIAAALEGAAATPDDGDPTDVPETPEKAAEKPVEAAAAPEKPAPVVDDTIYVTIDGAAGQPPLEIPCADQAAADRINELVNNGLRKAEFKERLEKIEEREAQQRQVTSMIESAPAAFVLQYTPATVQQEIATALLAAHWDALIPTIIKWADPAQGTIDRKTFAVDQRDAQRTAQQKWESDARAQRQTMALFRSVQSLIPEGTPDAKAQRFIQLADVELTQLARKGVALTPQQVPSLLAEIVSDFQFTTAAASHGTKAGQPPTAPKAPATSTQTRVRSEDARLAKIAKARQIGQRVAPQGAGGIPAQPAKLPKPVNPRHAVKEALNFMRDNKGQFSAVDRG